MFVFVLLISCLPVLFLLPYKFQLHFLCGFSTFYAMPLFFMIYRFLRDRVAVRRQSR